MKINQFIIIGLLVCCLVFFISKKYINQQDSPRPVEAEFEHYYLKCQMMQWLSNEGLEINNIKLFYGNDTSKIEHLYDLINKPTLIYYVSGKMCSSCIQFGIKKTKEYFGEFENNVNVILLASDMTPREKRALYNNECYSFFDENEKLSIPIEDTNLPFFFVIDTNKKVTMFFLPDSTNPIFTEKYLEIISRRFIHRQLQGHNDKSGYPLTSG